MCFPNEPEYSKPDESLLKKYHLSIKQMVFIGGVRVWATATTEDMPIYAVFNRGTNDLVILEWTKNNPEWKPIELEKVENLYGLVWLLTYDLLLAPNCKLESRW